MSSPPSMLKCSLERVSFFGFSYLFFLNLYNEKVERLLPMNVATDLSEILRKRRKHIDFVGDVFYV